MRRRAEPQLRVQNLGPIRDAQIELGNLTVLVGPQATGKSLLLQMLKLCIDGPQIVEELERHGFYIRKKSDVVDFFLGEGMGGIWDRRTSVEWQGKSVDLAGLVPKQTNPSTRRRSEELIYIPAQRSLAMADGWPCLFGEFQISPPYVLRSFSQSLHIPLGDNLITDLFRRGGFLEPAIREHIDSSIFHGGKLYVDSVGRRRQLKLKYRGAQPSFSSWTAGQREFVPLLLSVKRLSPMAKWVVLEEPEMGLHPEAILSVMLLVLDCLSQGYRVAVTTHSPLVLDLIWALRRLQEQKAKAADVLALFGVRSSATVMERLGREALTKSYRVYYLDNRDDKGVVARDISELDPGADEEWMSGWGGLTGVSSRISAVVSRVLSRTDEG